MDPHAGVHTDLLIAQLAGVDIDISLHDCTRDGVLPRAAGPIIIIG